MTGMSTQKTTGSSDGESETLDASERNSSETPAGRTELGGDGVKDKKYVNYFC